MSTGCLQNALSIVGTALDAQAEGEIALSFREDGEMGHIKVTERIHVPDPTPGKVLQVLRQCYASGFRGNLIFPRQLENPFVIVKESFLNPKGRQGTRS